MQHPDLMEHVAEALTGLRITSVDGAKFFLDHRRALSLAAECVDLVVLRMHRTYENDLDELGIVREEAVLLTADVAGATTAAQLLDGMWRTTLEAIFTDAELISSDADELPLLWPIDPAGDLSVPRELLYFATGLLTGHAIDVDGVIVSLDRGNARRIALVVVAATLSAMHPLVPNTSENLDSLPPETVLYARTTGARSIVVERHDSHWRSTHADLPRPSSATLAALPIESWITLWPWTRPRAA